MNLVLSILLVIVSVTLAVVSLVLMYNLRENSYLRTCIQGEREGYRQLEIGRDEETEAYQQEMLSLVEKFNVMSSIANTQNAIIKDLTEITKFHDANCLPHVDRDVEARIKRYQADYEARLAELKGVTSP